MGGPEGGGQVALELHRVDGEDHLRAGEACALHGRRPDAPDADHGHVVTGPYVRRVDRGAPAGGDAAADEAGLVERDVVEDLHARRLVDHGVGGEGAEAHHGGDVLAPGVVAHRSVELLARHEDAADVAEVRVTRGARGALPAGGDEAQHHVVAGGQAGDAGTHFLDHPGALVSADDGEGHGHVAGEQVLVGMAHARCRQLDEDLALLRRVELDGLDAPRLTVPQNSCFGLHGPSQGAARRRLTLPGAASGLPGWAVGGAGPGGLSPAGTSIASRFNEPVRPTRWGKRTGGRPDPRGARRGDAGPLGGPRDPSGARLGRRGPSRDIGGYDLIVRFGDGRFTGYRSWPSLPAPSTHLPVRRVLETLYGLPGEEIDWARTRVKRRRAILHPPVTRTRTSS